MNVSPVRFSSVSNVNKSNRNTHKHKNPSFGMELTDDSQAGLNEYMREYWNNYCPCRVENVLNKIKELDSGDIKLKIEGIVEVSRRSHECLSELTGYTRVYRIDEEAYAYSFVKGDIQSCQYVCTEEDPEDFYDEMVSDLQEFKRAIS